MSQLIEDTHPPIQSAGLNTKKNVDFSGATTVLLPAGTTLGGASLTALGAITSSSANSFSVGLNGTTNPAFNVDSSTGSQAAGLNVVGATAAGTVALAVISSGAAANLTVNALGTGTIGIGSISTGAVTITPATTITGALTLTAALKSTPQALSGAGAINVTTLVTKVTTTGANALTLADGTDGQVKIISNPVNAGTGTLTPTTKTGYSTIAFTAAGQGVVLVFNTTQGWIVVGNNGATLA